MKTRVKILDARYNDSVEDWILDDMVQSTLRPFFKWQSSNKEVNVQFVRTWEVEGYSPKIIIEAEFNQPTDAGLFELSFNDLPLESLRSFSFS